MFKRSKQEIINIVGDAFEKGMTEGDSAWVFRSPLWGEKITIRDRRPLILDKKMNALLDYLGLEFKEEHNVIVKAEVVKKNGVGRPRKKK